MDNCNHFWVARKDGYEEQCAPAICLICGEYGCYCRLRDTLKGMPPVLELRRKILFKELGINGEDHKIEKELKEKQNASDMLN